MSATRETPTNINFLSPLNHRFFIKRAPTIDFMLQKVTIPGLSLPPAPTNNPFVRVHYSGDHIDFGSLEITFKVDEDMINYLEIYHWLIALGYPRNFGQYADIAKQPQYTGDGLKSDIYLVVMTSSRNPNYEIVFQDAFPTALGPTTFVTDENDVKYVTTTASFTFTKFSIHSINEARSE